MLLLTKKPNAEKTGDELARDVALERLATFVPRSERDLYVQALERAEINARARGYEFRLIDAEQALVQIGVRKTPTLVLVRGSAILRRLEGRATGRQIEELIGPFVGRGPAQAA